MALIRKCGPDWLNAKLAAREILIMDGAMGTELESRGVRTRALAICWGVICSTNMARVSLSRQVLQITDREIF